MGGVFKDPILDYGLRYFVRKVPNLNVHFNRQFHALLNGELLCHQTNLAAGTEEKLTTAIKLDSFMSLDRRDIGIVKLISILASAFLENAS